MNETNPTTTTSPESHNTDDAAPRRGPDLLPLVTGLGALGITGTELLGGIGWLPELDGRWVLAALALIVGLLLVIGSLGPPRR